MFLAVPTGNGRPLRVAPLATILLVLLNVGAASWILPAAGRVASERRIAERDLVVATADCKTSTEGRPQAATAARLESARAAARTARRLALDATDPFACWGYRAGAAPWRAVSALFVHTDALHLCGNLLVLALVGALLEQAWGAAGVLLLYLAAGAGSLYVDARFGPPALLLGASGAVAALFGAYCLRFRGSPLLFRYMHLVYLRPHSGSFAVPCLVVAALWLVQQVAASLIEWRSGDGGVAFVSHLVGFGLGLGAALAAGLVATHLRSDPVVAVPRTPRWTPHWPGSGCAPRSTSGS